MILAFADDSTVSLFDTIVQANSSCEAIDVKNLLYVFIDEHGFVLRAIFPTLPTESRFLLITTVSEGTFVLERTADRRRDLIEKLDSGEITIDSGPTSVRSLSELKVRAPELFL